jgi:methanogenic corrinoid protein MtbC1
LRDVQQRLFEAGLSGNLEAAEDVIDGAVAARIRAVDILIGIIAPMLYKIGEGWKRGAVSVAEEHRFTAFCEGLFESIAARVGLVSDACTAQRGASEVIVINAPGNTHTLAARILSLWLTYKGTPVRLIREWESHEELLALIRHTEPRLLLVSMALAEQLPGVVAIAERVAQLPTSKRPRVVVGGYAIKAGLVATIPGADLVRDISSL